MEGCHMVAKITANYQIVIGSNMQY